MTRLLSQQTIPFEASKISFGQPIEMGLPFLHWQDSSKTRDTSMVLFGNIDLKKDSLYIRTAKLFTNSSRNNAVISYTPHPMRFDSTGNIGGYFDFGSNSDGSKWKDSVWGEILFPPSPKSIVPPPAQLRSDLVKIINRIGTEDHQVFLISEMAIGETKASLYSIDGRLLKQEKIFISVPGIYTFDASGVTGRIGILVLKTEKGIIAKKVIL
jgi:hypothetical protein